MSPPEKMLRFNGPTLRKTQSVKDFYNGQSVFITGGTGFLGKIILEKLLYKCHGLHRVYFLIREKKNVKPLERLQKVFEEPIFSRLRKEYPQAFKKVVPIIGDVSESKLGIKLEDEKLLIEAVSIVIHLAATVRFNEPLEVAVNINVKGTERLLDLCQRMKSIKCFVYFSTTASNANQEVIEEILYPPPASLTEVQKMIENGINEEEVKKLLNKLPNTYAFTKGLTEALVAEKHKDIPTVIIRPAVVTSCMSEPVVGWVDVSFGVTSLITVISKGLNRVLLAKPDNVIDLIPVDYVANLTIVAAAETNKRNAKDVAVYNCATSKGNPVRLSYIKEAVIADSYENKAYELPMPFVYFTQFQFIVSLITLIFQTIPACVADAILYLRGKRPRYRFINSKVIKVRETLEYFSNKSWSVCAAKTMALADALSVEDKIDFPFHPKDINWHEYMPSFCKGTRELSIKK